jgi:MbtH protein
VTEPTEDIEYVVVMNHEEQYSIWAADIDPPAGWVIAGPTGTKDACLDHIERVWTDMRPLSVRRALEGGQGRA